MKKHQSPCGNDYPTFADMHAHETTCGACAAAVETMRAEDFRTAREVRQYLVAMSDHYPYGTRERAQISAARVALSRLACTLLEGRGL